MKKYFETLKILFKLLPKGSRSQLFWLVPLMIVAAIFEMIGLALVLPLVNAISGTDSFGGLAIFSTVQKFLSDLGGQYALIFMGGFVALFYLLKNSLLFYAIFSENRFIMKAVRDTAVYLLNAYLAAPYEFHLHHNSAELIRNLTSSVDDAFRGMMRPILRMASEGLVILGILIVLIVADPVVTLSMGALMAVLLGGFVKMTHSRIARWGWELQRLFKENIQCLHHSLGSLKEVRVLGRQQYFADSYFRLRDKMSTIYTYNQSVAELPRLSIETLLVFAFIIALSIVIARGEETRHVLPLLALYAFAGFRLMPSFNRVILFANAVRFSSPSLHNVVAHHQSIKDIVVPSLTALPESLVIPLNERVEFRNVTFCYSGADSPTIIDFSFEIPRGQSIALVGSSGAGKSTVADLLLGLLSPQSGEVLVDGVNIAGNIPAWQRNIGYIPQHIYLLDDTLRRNIALAVNDKEIDDARLDEAIRLAHLGSVVKRLPEGVETRLGENGSRLSGGERQRVGIARALYHQPQLIVMDEATSALDNETERDVSQAINALAGERTLVIIAHRLSTIRHCDCVVMLQDGKITDRGTYDWLLQNNAKFKALATQSDPEHPQADR